MIHIRVKPPQLKRLLLIHSQSLVSLLRLRRFIHQHINPLQQSTPFFTASLPLLIISAQNSTYNRYSRTILLPHATSASCSQSSCNYSFSSHPPLPHRPLLPFSPRPFAPLSHTQTQLRAHTPSPPVPTTCTPCTPLVSPIFPLLPHPAPRNAAVRRSGQATG